MKATIEFSHGPCPSLVIEGHNVGLVAKVEIDIDQTHGTIKLDKLHVSPRQKQHIPGLAPGQPPVLLPWEAERPDVPDHPCIVKLP